MVAPLDVRAALGNLLRRDPRSREQLHQVGAGQVLDRPRVGDLVDAAADEQVPRQRPRNRMVDHLVHLQLAVAGTGLEEEVVGQVLDEVAGREDVVTRPRPPLRVLGKRALAAGQEVVRVADALEGLQRRSRRRLAVRRRRTGEHRVDRRGDELDMAELLGRDVRHQVVERPRTLPVAEVERLERVVQPRRHLAEAATHQLLDGSRAFGVGVGRGRQLRGHPVVTQDHRCLHS